PGRLGLRGRQSRRAGVAAGGGAAGGPGPVGRPLPRPRRLAKPPVAAGAGRRRHAGRWGPAGRGGPPPAGVTWAALSRRPRRPRAVGQNRQSLQALADDAMRDGGAQLGELSPQLLVSLGLRLRVAGADPVSLWRAAQRRHPNDFWLSLYLGNTLRGTKQDEEGL